MGSMEVGGAATASQDLFGPEQPLLELDSEVETKPFEEGALVTLNDLAVAVGVEVGQEVHGVAG